MRNDSQENDLKCDYKKASFTYISCLIFLFTWLVVYSQASWICVQPLKLVFLLR